MFPINSVVLFDGQRAKVQRDVGAGDFIVKLITGPQKGERLAVNARYLLPLEVKVDRDGVHLKARDQES